MKKRIYCMLLCVALVLSLALMGCTVKQTQEPAQTEQPDQTTTVTEEKEPPTEAETTGEKKISFTWLHHLQEEGKKAWVQYCADTYMEAHPNVTITTEMQNTDNFMTVLKTKIATDDAPMIFDLEPTQLTEFQQAGHLAELSDITGLENYSEALLDEGRREGGQYGVPLDANSFNALYNKDLFDQLGLSVPTTLSEFDHVCKTLQENGITPIACGFAEQWTIRRYSNIYTDIACVKDNPNWFVEKMNRTSTFSEDQAFKDSISLYMSYKPYWGEDPYGTKQADALNQVAAGKAGIVINGTWTIDGLLAINPDLNIGAFAIPTSEDPSGAIMEMKPGNSFCVFNSDDPELLAVAKDFFTFMCSQDSASYYALNAHSIPGSSIEVETIEPLNDILAYSGDQVYMMSGVTTFSGEYHSIYLELLQKHGMEETFDVDALCADLDNAFAGIQ